MLMTLTTMIMMKHVFFCSRWKHPTERESPRSVSIISIFEFSVWESQIRTNSLWRFFWHDVGFQCARVSAQKNTMKFGKSTAPSDERQIGSLGGRRSEVSSRDCSLGGSWWNMLFLRSSWGSRSPRRHRWTAPRPGPLTPGLHNKISA